MFLNNLKLASLSRYQAFAGHLVVSLIIFVIIFLCITQLWYPGILFDSSNGLKAVGLIISIDLILGPMLTLIVFNPKKSSLPFDLSIIAIVQVLALAYGIWTIHSSRPLAIAHINTSFITLYANAENSEKIKQRIIDLNTNKLYYVFDDNEVDKDFNTSQLESYETHASAVLNINSPYTKTANSSQKLLIQIDPLTSSDRYLIISEQDGHIIGFTDDSKF